MTSGPSGAPEERGWGAAPEAIALVGSLVIVGLHERLEAALQGRATGEVTAAKGHAPVLVQDRALEAFDEPRGPGLPRFGPRVAEAEGVARDGDCTLRQVEAGNRSAPCERGHFYVWKKKCAHLGVSELRRLLQLEDENGRLMARKLT